MRTGRLFRIPGVLRFFAPALALEGALNDATFLAGPVLVTTLSATFAPWTGLALATLLVAAGIAGILGARASEPPPGRARAGPGRGSPRACP